MLDTASPTASMARVFGHKVLSHASAPESATGSSDNEVIELFD